MAHFSRKLPKVALTALVQIGHAMQYNNALNQLDQLWEATADKRRSLISIEDLLSVIFDNWQLILSLKINKWAVRQMRFTAWQFACCEIGRCLLLLDPLCSTAAMINNSSLLSR